MTARSTSASAGDTPAQAAPFGSLLSALVTPFTADGSPDLEAAQRLAVHLVEQGHDGLVVSGTTGESATTSDQEKAQLIAAVVAAVGERASIVAGVSTPDTAHSVELARQARTAGADGVLVVTPYYTKPPQSGILAHITAIADAAEVPVMLYDIPGRCGVKLAPETILRAAEHIGVVALKDASGDFAAGSRIMASTDLAFYCGDDHLTLPWLALGAVGTVSVVAQVASAQYRTLIDAVASQDLATARRVHNELLPLADAIMCHTQGAIMVKAALEMQQVIPRRTVRAPLVAATLEELSLLTPFIKTPSSHSAPMEARA
jgi:4-hydroxy-tetrahydrodipicolinate synthase